MLFNSKTRIINLIILLVVIHCVSCTKKEKSCDLNIAFGKEDCLSKNVDSSINGFTVNYDANGQKVSEGNYTNGIQSGFWKYYFSDGKLMKEGNFQSEKINGFWKKYYPSGNVEMEGNYTNCVRNGFWKFYYDNPTNQVQQEGNIKNDLKSGSWKTYSIDGEILTDLVCPS